MKKIMLSLCLIFGFTAALSAQTVKADATVAAINLDDYAGKYSFSETFKQVQLEVNNGELFAEVDEYGKNKLLKESATDTFKSTSSYGTVFIFKRNKEGKVVGLTLQLMGQELSGVKD